MLKKILFIFLCFYSIAIFSQVINTGMTTNYDSLEKGKIVIGGYLDVYYGFDFNKPSNKERAYSVSSSRHNEVNVNLTYIDLRYTNDKVRGRIVPGFGTYINSNYSNEKGSLKNLVEANAGVCISNKKDIWLDAGVLGSPFTNETAISKDHLMYTRSFGVEYSPYYLSGVKLSYPVTSKIKSYLYVINGWQQVFDVNNSLSLCTQLEYRPSKKVLMNWDTYFGNENSLSSPNYGMRYFSDIYVIYDSGKKFKFTSCSYVGIQNLKDSLGVKSNSIWWQSNFTGSYKINKDISLAGRLEYINDPSSILINPITSKIGFFSYSSGLCLNIMVSNNAMFRVEDRLCFSDQKVYLNKNHNESTINNLLVGSLTVWF